MKKSKWVKVNGQLIKRSRIEVVSEVAVDTEKGACGFRVKRKNLHFDNDHVVVRFFSDYDIVGENAHETLKKKVTKIRDRLVRKL